MKHLEEHQIQGNRTSDDVLMYYTTIGWMMWNWMVSALALGNISQYWAKIRKKVQFGDVALFVSKAKINVF